MKTIFRTAFYLRETFRGQRHHEQGRFLQAQVEDIKDGAVRLFGIAHSHRRRDQTSAINQFHCRSLIKQYGQQY